MENEFNPHAFPCERDEPEKGITLRDYFAAKAMQALISKMDENYIREKNYYNHFFLTENSYHIADEMLKARQTNPQT